jgi:ribosomal protein L12E/L44/L45/RPP1/RPP2
MTKDDIRKLAREAGFKIDGDSWIHAGVVLVDGRKSIDEQLKRFAALVASAEREACAKLCDDLDDGLVDGLAGWQYGEALRARGEQT